MKTSNKKQNRITQKQLTRIKAELMYHYSISYSDIKRMQLGEALALHKELDRILAEERLAQWMITVYPYFAGENKEYTQAFWEMLDPVERSPENRRKRNDEIKKHTKAEEEIKQQKFRDTDQALKSLFGKK